MSSPIKTNNPDVCPVPDFSNYPNILNGLSAQDLTAFLCDVIKMSRRDDVDPVLRPGPSAFDISPWIDSLTTLTDVGDPRLSMGELMKFTYDKYKPLLDIKLSILQDGCQLIGETICDDSGKELYKIKEVCGGQFGVNEVTEDITLESLEKFTYDIWNSRVDKSASDFAEFLRTNYIRNNWDVELITYSTGDLKKIKYGREVPVFFAKVSKFITGTYKPSDDSEDLNKLPFIDIGDRKKVYKYFKYFFDARQKVADKLKIPLKVAPINELRASTDIALMEAFTGPYWPETVD